MNIRNRLRAALQFNNFMNWAQEWVPQIAALIVFLRLMQICWVFVDPYFRTTAKFFIRPEIVDSWQFNWQMLWNLPEAVWEYLWHPHFNFLNPDVFELSAGEFLTYLWNSPMAYLIGLWLILVFLRSIFRAGALGAINTRNQALENEVRQLRRLVEAMTEPVETGVEPTMQRAIDRTRRSLV